MTTKNKTIELTGGARVSLVTTLLTHATSEAAAEEDTAGNGALRRTWLEHNPRKGYRLVRQTQDPRTGRWCVPKRSTYVMAAVLVRNPAGEVDWHTLHRGAAADELADWVQSWPHTATSAAVVAMFIDQLVYLCAFSTGQAFFTINGERREDTEADRRRYLARLGSLESVLPAVLADKPKSAESARTRLQAARAAVLLALGEAA